MNEHNDTEPEEIEQQVIDLLEKEGKMTHRGVSESLNITINESGNVLSRLVVTNRASVNSKWEYSLIY